ncbi:hypothetical protein L6164_013697 [Bauhinia variegata]|uniref:Uncharacterized protein n=1 Tax=Bauhinia variegata TaxID=167791 RepID=A0ACB9NEV2_BAUVA|nr:hypothetical protein L6164_013697 [Bauhinia variegata]
MTASKSLALIFIIQALLATFSIPLTRCRSSPRNDNALITSTYITGLGLIMVQVMKAKANDATNKINQLLRASTDPKQKQALSSCADKYKAVLVADVPMAVEALQKGDPKFAEEGANDAAIEANSCEQDFAGKSPLTSYNNAMHDVATVAAAIVRNLL